MTDNTEPTDPTAPTGPKPGRQRVWWIVGGIVAAVVLLGGGIAIGAALSDDDDDDDRPVATSTPAPSEAQPSTSPTDGSDGSDDGDTPATGLPGGDIGTASADDLIAIADAALTLQDGDVVSIDAKRTGAWEVEVIAADLTEYTVRVNTDGSAEVIAQDPADNDDVAPALVLDDDSIRSLADAALAEADGNIVEMDADDDRHYTVVVRGGDRAETEIEFDADFTVIGFDRD